MTVYSNIFNGEIPIPLQQVSLGLSLLLLIAIIWLVRHDRLKPGYSIIWLVVAVIMVIFSLHVSLLSFIADMLGINYTPAVLFLILLIGFIFIALHFSLLFCRYDRRIRNLAQEHALLKEELTRDKLKK